MHKYQKNRGGKLLFVLWREKLLNFRQNRNQVTNKKGSQKPIDYDAAGGCTGCDGMKTGSNEKICHPIQSNPINRTPLYLGRGASKIVLITDLIFRQKCSHLKPKKPFWTQAGGW